MKIVDILWVISIILALAAVFFLAFSQWTKIPKELRKSIEEMGLVHATYTRPWLFRMGLTAAIGTAIVQIILLFFKCG